MGDNEPGFLGQLRLGRQLTGLFQIAVIGLATLLGLVYLLGDPSVDALRRPVILGPLLGTAAVVLTLVNVFEMLAGAGEEGGTYGLAFEVLGGLGGLLDGWVLLAGQLLLTAAFIQLAGSVLSGLLPYSFIQPWMTSTALLVALLLVELFHLIPKRPRMSNLVGVLLALMVVAVIVALLRANIGQALQPSPNATINLSHSVAHFAVLYAGIESLMFARRQMRQPGRAFLPSVLGALAIGGVLMAVFGLAQGGLARGTLTAGLATTLGAGGQPQIVGESILALAAALLGAHSTTMASARTVFGLSRRGGLPNGFRQLRRPFSLPPLLFAVVAVVALPLVVWAPPESVVDTAAFMFLAGMIIVDIAAFESRQTEPERRRDLLLPLFPLFPLAAIAVNAGLLLALPVVPMAAGAIWVVLGTLFYVAYARPRLVAAQAGQITFGRDQRIEKPEGTYRILVPLSGTETRHTVLGLAAGLARQLRGDVIPLQVITMPDPLAMEQGRRVAQERNTLFQWSTRMATEEGIVVSPITRLSRSVAEGIIDTAVEETCDLILMPWRVGEEAAGEDMGRVIDPVVSGAPCDVAVVAYHRDQIQRLQGPAEENSGAAPPALKINKIMVPTAGGPHAPLAVGLALMLAKEYGAEVDSVYVTEPGASEAEIQVGELRIRGTLETLGERAAQMLHFEPGQQVVDQSQVQARVVQAENVVDGIVEAAESTDLAFIGSSEESVIDQVLFGNLPRQVAAASPVPVIMVRRYQGLSRFWLTRAWDTISRVMPTLSAEEQIDIYKRVRRGARPDVDFFVMMGLAAIIATYGLLQNSGAVIIGAMLVAPLFTPILAFSLSIALGDVRLLRLSIEATLKGVFLAIGLAVVLAYVSPMQSDPRSVAEIVARTQPNLFDLIVALASGAAGAYAIARRDVAAALPGVAIAAALVPPLGVIGIGVSQGDFAVAGGGTLLVLTNLVAISLAGSITLLLLGFRPAPRGERQARLRTGLVASVILLVVISLPLAAVLVNTVRRSQDQHIVQHTLQQQIQPLTGVDLTQVFVQQTGSGLDVTATLYAPQNHPSIDAAQLADALRQALNAPVTLKLVVIPVTEITQPAP